MVGVLVACVMLAPGLQTQLEKVGTFSSTFYYKFVKMNAFKLGVFKFRIRIFINRALYI